MRLCNDKILADWIDVTPRRVRQLRDEGVIDEKAPGFYDHRASVKRYINYIRRGSRMDLNDERAMLTKAKREAAEMENAIMRQELHRTEEVDKGIKTMCLNIRSRFLSMPAKLAPKLAALGGDQAAIFDELKRAIDETLEGLSRYDVAMALAGGMEDGTEDEDDTV